MLLGHHLSKLVFVKTYLSRIYVLSCDTVQYGTDVSIRMGKYLDSLFSFSKEKAWAIILRICCSLNYLN